MLRRETLVLMSCLERCSTPTSRSSIHVSKFSIWLWKFSTDKVLWLMRDCKAVSTFTNSFVSDSWGSQFILSDCISLEIIDHLLCFDCPLVSETNTNKDSSNLTVAASTSFKMPRINKDSVLLLEEETINSFFIPFKLPKAFWIAFFIFFLNAKYFPPSTANSVSAPFLQ